MSDDHWFVDVSDEPQGDAFKWQAFLQVNNLCLPLPIWFMSERECEDFIAKIPSGWNDAL